MTQSQPMNGDPLSRYMGLIECIAQFQLILEDICQISGVLFKLNLNTFTN